MDIEFEDHTRPAERIRYETKPDLYSRGLAWAIAAQLVLLTLALAIGNMTFSASQ